MKDISEKELKEVQNDGKKIILDVYASWCGPCKVLTPILERIETDYPNIEFLKMDIQKNMEFAKENGIISIPTVILFNGNNEVKKITGLNKEDFYRNLLNNL